jgi:murein DD-endopeptidase MepM/ murein hydrolase activator NlpD
MNLFNPYCVKFHSPYSRSGVRVLGTNATHLPLKPAINVGSFQFSLSGLKIFHFFFAIILLNGCHSRQGVLYKIEKGDTLWRVAHFHDADMLEIKRANPQLDPNNLKPGEKILLPQVQQVRKVPKQKLNTEKWMPKSDLSVSKKSKSSKSKSAQREKVDDSSLFKFSWPYKGPVISSFGMRSLKMHNGIDIQIPANESIRAAYDGKVVHLGEDIEGYDRIVILLHDHHFFSIYAYLGEFLVQQDQVVKTGTAIAKPRPSSPSYFHFELRYIKTALDPERYLK